MSKADIYQVEQLILEVKPQLQAVVKEGTSKGDNRAKYKKIKARLTRLNRWLNELKN